MFPLALTVFEAVPLLILLKLLVNSDGLSNISKLKSIWSTDGFAGMDIVEAILLSSCYFC